MAAAPTPRLVALIEAHFSERGWRVGRNIPYAGGHTTEFHGCPAEGIHAVQIEIDRSLYLEPLRMQRNARLRPMWPRRWRHWLCGWRKMPPGWGWHRRFARRPNKPDYPTKKAAPAGGMRGAARVREKAAGKPVALRR